MHAVEAGGAGGARDVAAVARELRLEVALLEAREQLLARLDERARQIDRCARERGRPDGGRHVRARAEAGAFDTSTPPVMAMVRSMKLRSSRTLPGHGCDMQAASSWPR